MATVYSLVCWGGLTGKIVSISAATDNASLTNHGLRNGIKLWPSGTLPSGLSSSVPVYARSIDANTFSLHTSAADAVANTGKILFAGSSTYSAVVLKSDLVASPATALAAYGLSDLSRWGSRIYDGLISWYSARSAGNTEFAEEICEIGEAFTESTNVSLDMTFKSPRVLVTPKINGLSTPAFSAGVFNAGFVHRISGYGVVFRSPGITFEGFEIAQAVGQSTRNIEMLSYNSLARYMLLSGVARAPGSEGVRLSSIGARVEYCIAVGFQRGFAFAQYINYAFAYNCIACDNTIGFGNPYDGTDQVYASTANCVSLGNATNWNVPGTKMMSADRNIGLAGEAWVSGTGAYRIEVSADWNTTTPLFANYANKDFRPFTPLNANSSLLVDGGKAYFNIPTSDIAGREVPCYAGGAAEYVDCGAFEFDKGFGPRPSATNVTFSGVIAGSEIHIYDVSGNELAGVESCVANQVLTWAIPANPTVTITIIKRGYQWRRFSYGSAAGDKSIPIFQQVDLGYNNPA